ncbi:hypothetical protein AAVH_27998 [Aphelenchoides avenae]|nr:hypothetical protein AAVH_27998 [Aphelenchus avenae]
MAALKERLRAKADSPKRLLKAIRFEAKKLKTEEGTLVESGVPLPANVSRSMSVHYGWHYGVYAGVTCLGDFTIGAAPTVAQSFGGVDVDVTVYIDVKGLLTISTEHDGTKKEFTNFARV